MVLFSVLIPALIGWFISLKVSYRWPNWWGVFFAIVFGFFLAYSGAIFSYGAVSYIPSVGYDGKFFVNILGNALYVGLFFCIWGAIRGRKNARKVSPETD